MKLDLEQHTRKLFLLWVLANACAALLIQLSALVTHGWALQGPVQTVLFFALPGFAQWLVLKQYFQVVRARRWILATALGEIIGIVVAVIPLAAIFLVSRVAMAGPVATYAYGLPLAAISGAGIGWRQGRVLQRDVYAASWKPWVIANTVGGFATGLLTPGRGFFTTDPLADNIISVVTVTAASAVGAYITGRVLVRFYLSIQPETE